MGMVGLRTNPMHHSSDYGESTCDGWGSVSAVVELLGWRRIAGQICFTGLRASDTAAKRGDGEISQRMG